MALFAHVKHWLHGLLAALIGGGASAVSAAIGPMLIAPQQFHLADEQGLHNILKTMLTGFVVSGLLSAFAYLKQSPLPPEGNGDTDFLYKPQPKDK